MAIILLLLLPFISSIALFIFGNKKSLLEKISVVSSILEVIFASIIIWQVFQFNNYSLSLYFSVNALNGLLLIIAAIIGLVATLHSVGYFAQELKKRMIDQKKLRDSYLLIRLFLFFIYAATLTTNPILMWIAVEGTTLVTVFMINIFNRKTDLEAAWKFFIINSIGLLLGLLGTLLFLTQGGSTQILLQWKDIINANPSMNAQSLKFAFIFVLIGYGTKIGLVPMHTWKPDTYNKAPLPMVALLATVLLNTAFLAILKFMMVTNHIVGTSFTSNLLIFFGIISIVLAANIIYTQKNLKRLLAYSTIEHAGLISLGFGFGGIGIFGAMLHMFYHSFSKSLLFLLSSNVVVKYSTSVFVNIRGMIKILPQTSILYLFTVLFVLGLPPFGLFFSEFYIFASGLSHHLWITILAIIMLIFVFIGFLKSVLGMIFTTPTEDIVKGEGSYWTLIPVGVLAIMLIFVSIYLPGFVLHLLKESANLIITNTP